MDYDLPNQRWPREQVERDNQLRRELDEATPSTGSAGLIIGAVILIILGVVFFGSPGGNNATSVASRDTVQPPAPTTPPDKR
jgi:hypothetical protein